MSREDVYLLSAVILQVPYLYLIMALLAARTRATVAVAVFLLVTWWMFCLGPLYWAAMVLWLSLWWWAFGLDGDFSATRARARLWPPPQGLTIMWALTAAWAVVSIYAYSEGVFRNW